MMFSVSRLKLVEKIIAGEVLSETDFDYTFGEFGQEIRENEDRKDTYVELCELQR